MANKQREENLLKKTVFNPPPQKKQKKNLGLEISFPIDSFAQRLIISENISDTVWNRSILFSLMFFIS